MQTFLFYLTTYILKLLTVFFFESTEEVEYTDPIIRYIDFMDYSFISSIV